MPKTIKEIIETFDLEFDDYRLDAESQGYQLVRDNIKIFLNQALLSLLDEVDKRLPEEIIDDGEYYSTEYKNGFNDCLDKVIKILSDIKEGK